MRVSIPDPDSVETPAAGVGVIALPYDRDSILASLEARPAPPAAHRGPGHALRPVSWTVYSLYRCLLRASQLRDSLDRCDRSLDSGSSSAPLKRLADSIRLLERQSTRPRELDRARAEFVSRSESLRAAVRHWEDSTYRGYDSIVENLARAARREPVTDTTGATGWAHFDAAAPGRWWIYARAWDTSDPNAEWYWNVPLQRRHRPALQPYRPASTAILGDG